jgi:hypothetical protein
MEISQIYWCFQNEKSDEMKKEEDKEIKGSMGWSKVW